MIIAGTSILYCYMFYLAYFNETQSMIMYVNRQGEGDLEAYTVIPFILLSVIGGVVISLRNML